ADHASKVHRGKNDSRHQCLRQLACRHKIDHALSVEHYGIMNDRPNTPAPKQENKLDPDSDKDKDSDEDSDA
ncbi:2132_t:CDS:2, partial [Dentiscutata heterogama]